MLHAMIDLETLGTAADAVILSVGAVLFDPYKDDVVSEFYSTGIDIDQHDRKIDDGTLRWWFKQGDAARAQHIVERVMLYDVMTDLRSFLKPVDGGVWGNGADFDNAILNHAWRSTCSRSDTLYPYWQTRCFRTFVNLFDPTKKYRPQSNDHNALNDCLNQVKWMQRIVANEEGVPQL